MHCNIYKIEIVKIWEKDDINSGLFYLFILNLSVLTLNINIIEMYVNDII